MKNALVRSRIKGGESKNQGMRKCGKIHCQICIFVDEGDQFDDGDSKFYLNHSFDCDS